MHFFINAIYEVNFRERTIRLCRQNDIREVQITVGTISSFCQFLSQFQDQFRKYCRWIRHRMGKCGQGRAFGCLRTPNESTNYCFGQSEEFWNRVTKNLRTCDIMMNITTIHDETFIAEHDPLLVRSHIRCEKLANLQPLWNSVLTKVIYLHTVESIPYLIVVDDKDPLRKMKSIS